MQTLLEVKMWAGWLPLLLLLKAISAHQVSDGYYSSSLPSSLLVIPVLVTTRHPCPRHYLSSLPS